MVWNILGHGDQLSSQRKQLAEEFARGVELFGQRQFAEAAERFEAVLADSPEDKAAVMYVELCRQYLTQPPGDDWAGAVQLTEK